MPRQTPTMALFSGGAPASTEANNIKSPAQLFIVPPTFYDLLPTRLAGAAGWGPGAG